jgi:methyl-accepting chemotaxis protein
MNQEYILSSDTIILSTSDMRGNIVDFNEGFVEASGYSASELKGKPHNLLRHPDMPKEAFKDLWQTIQDGRPWFGIVKNKRKNGDYYWVAANASPICQNGKITGFVSVRYPATDEQKQMAHKLYTDIRTANAAMPWTPNPSKLSGVWTLAIPFAFLFTSLLLSMFMSEQRWANLAAILLFLLGTFLLVLQRVRENRVPEPLWQGIERLANGNFRSPIIDYSRWGQGLNMIRTRIAEQSAMNYDDLRAAKVLATALDAASTNVMVADENFVIQRMNKSLTQMFSRNASKLQQVIPGFSVEGIIGSSMDAFHQDPAHQRKVLSQLKDGWQGELNLAGLVLRLTVVPIHQKGRCIGYVVEWLDRTTEALVVSQIANAVEAVKAGEFEHRVTAEADGVLNVIKQDLNDALSVMQLAVDGITKLVVLQSEGDFTQDCKENFTGQLGELKSALNASSAKLREVIEVAKQASTIVSQQAEQVSNSARQLSHRVQEQAAALEETSATMDEMNSAVQSNTDSAKDTATVAHSVQLKAAKGSEVMQKTISAMQAIQQSSYRISEIVSLIDSIAFQTNLLALNAAVEAARAGEQGRGFAVVAGEVRALAQKSAEAAKDIRMLIEDSVARVDEGTRLAEESGAMLADINKSIDTVSEMVSKIAKASSEQSAGIAQVHNAIAQIDGVTQQNAALVEETSQAAERLSEQALILQQDMAFFKTGEVRRLPRLRG